MRPWMTHSVVRRQYSQFLEYRFTDVGEVVKLKRQSPFNPKNIPGAHFRLILSGPQGHNAAQ
jgi:hypothetical protein